MELYTVKSGLAGAQRCLACIIDETLDLLNRKCLGFLLRTTDFIGNATGADNDTVLPFRHHDSRTHEDNLGDDLPTFVMDCLGNGHQRSNTTIVIEQYLVMLVRFQSGSGYHTGNDDTCSSFCQCLIHVAELICRTSFCISHTFKRCRPDNTAGCMNAAYGTRIK